MSKIFHIEDITAKKFLFEGSEGFIKGILSLVELSQIPFLRDHSFEPETPEHIILANEFKTELMTVKEEIEKQPEEFKLNGLDRDLALEFFTDTIQYCETHPAHEITCYIYS